MKYMKKNKKKIIPALMIGRAGSTGLPGKNIMKVFGKHLFEYPLIEAKKVSRINRIFVSTDCKVIKDTCKKRNYEIINRPKYLSSKEALGEDAFKHGHDKIKKKYEFDFIILLMANCPTVNSNIINKGIDILIDNPKIDSAVSVSRYNMFSPQRARILNKNKLLQPYLNKNQISIGNCDRDSSGNFYFADMGVSIVRSRCFENMENNVPPQKWMGKKIAPIFSECGFDIDYHWQIPLAKYWISNVSKKI
jgi:CMP-N-acetylneuraminic acid synthetase